MLPAKPELFRIHRSKIRLYRAKKTIATQRHGHPTFSKLAGLRTCVYHTVHAGALPSLLSLLRSVKRQQQAKSLSKTVTNSPNQSPSLSGNGSWPTHHRAHRPWLGGRNRHRSHTPVLKSVALQYGLARPNIFSSRAETRRPSETRRALHRLRTLIS